MIVGTRQDRAIQDNNKGHTHTHTYTLTHSLNMDIKHKDITLFCRFGCENALSFVQSIDGIEEKKERQMHVLVSVENWDMKQ